MLKMTKIELELITNLDMYIFFEEGIRGEIYDQKKKQTHIIYLDTNNLYDYAMSKFLPTSEFKRIDHKELNVFWRLILNILKSY